VTAAAALEVDVQVACEDDGVPGVDSIEAWVRAAHAGVGRLATGAEVAVRIVDTTEMQTLNSEYCGKDKSTNVLSFPAGKVAGLPADATPTLGDIVVCANVVAAEARAQKKAPGDHWAHMLVHGTLHLLGYVHEAEEDAREMESLETQILAGLGVSDPYRS